MKLITLEPSLPAKQRILDSMYHTDGTSLVDGIAIVSTIGMLFGVIYGSISPIGSIALGLIGLFVGGLIGYLLDIIINKRKNIKHADPSGEIIISILCQGEEHEEYVRSVFKEFSVVAVSGKVV